MTISWRAGQALIRSVHDYQKYGSKRGLAATLLQKHARLRHLFWSVFTGSDIDPQARIGTGVKLPHPNGVVIHGKAVIGDHCMIMQQVTVGQLEEDFAPVIGAGAYIGAGAKVLGKIVIGDRARIGANAVVLCDVPADGTAVGIPARIVEHQPRKST